MLMKDGRDGFIDVSEFQKSLFYLTLCEREDRKPSKAHAIKVIKKITGRKND